MFVILSDSEEQRKDIAANMCARGHAHYTLNILTVDYLKKRIAVGIANRNYLFAYPYAAAFNAIDLV